MFPTKRSHVLTACFALLNGLALPLAAATLASENFNYNPNTVLPSPPYTSGSASSSPTVLGTTSSGLAFPGLSTGTTAAYLNGTGDQAWAPLSSAVDANVDGSTIFSSFVMQYNLGGGQYNDYGGAMVSLLSLGNANTGVSIGFGYQQNGGTSPGQALFALDIGGDIVDSATPVSLDTSYYVLTKTVFNGGPYSGTIDTYMNFYTTAQGMPITEPTTWDIELVGESKGAFWGDNNDNLINEWGINTRNGGNNDYYGGSLGNVSIGTTLADVTALAVPEPSVSTLLGYSLAIAGLVLAGRHRSARHSVS